MGQLDFFEELPTSPSTGVIGLQVLLQSDCRHCGCATATVGSSKGPHHAALSCAACGEHRGWMDGQTHRFISGVIDVWGRPEAPVVVHQRRAR
jgi:hypothetical protein